MVAVGLFRHQQRYREIAGVISRHGLGWLVVQLGLEHVPVIGRIASRNDDEAIGKPQRVRLALEDLGPTFIKLGQILSTRDDLLPPEYITELSRLRERVVPAPFDAIREIIEHELGASLDETFAEFEIDPLAVASIGQVHAARLHDGASVVVKVHRPGAQAHIEDDLAILHQLAEFAERHSTIARDYSFVELADEFAWTLRNELDYLREGRMIETFSANFAEDPTVVIPTVHWAHTTSRVLTLGRIDGVRIDDLAGLEAAGIDRPALARQAARIILTEVFEHGLFHADPHPGNFAVLPDGRIVAYDFGMVGRLSSGVMRSLLMVAVVRRDPDRVIDEALTLDVIRGRIDRPALRRDVARLIDRYAEARISEIDIAVVIGELTGLIRKHHMRLPADLALLTKTLVMHESVAHRLDPAFAPIELAEPFARQALIDRYRPGVLGPRVATGMSDTLDLLIEGPRRLDRLLVLLERGNVEVSMRVSDWERMLGQLQALVNRLVIAWLTGASLISLAVLLAIYRPGWIEGWLGPLFWVGAAVTVAAGGILLLTVLRRRL